MIHVPRAQDVLIQIKTNMYMTKKKKVKYDKHHNLIIHC